MCVYLKHWTPNPIPFDTVAAVLNDVIRRCRTAKADSLCLVVPDSEKHVFGDVKQLGFLCERSQASVQLYSEGKSPVADDSSWRLTNIHTGFFDFE